MRIGLFQFDQIWQQRSANRTRIEQMLEENQDKVDLLVFPEMTLSGFSMDPSATTLDNNDRDFFSMLARTLHCSIVYGGVEEKQNCWIGLDNTGCRSGHYAKNHLFGYGDENRHYEAGVRNDPVTINGIISTPGICYNLRFAYHFWRLASKSTMIILIANWPASRRYHWKTLCTARAIENQCYLIAVNRIGTGGGLEYAGESMVIDPLGKIVLDAGAQDGLFVHDIDLDMVSRTRKQFPFLEDRKDSWT